MSYLESHVDYLHQQNLLPTPTTQEPSSQCEVNEQGRRMTKDGKDSHSLNLGRMASMNLLPTPMAQTRDLPTEEQIAKRKEMYGGKKRAMYLEHVIAQNLLPTPTSMEDRSTPEVWMERQKKQMEKGNTPFTPGLNVMAQAGLLPTPMTTEIHHKDRVQKLKETGAETMASRNNGSNRPNGLMDYLDFNQMLPTICAAEGSGKVSGNAKEQKSVTQMVVQTHGKTSQLNPRFVAEMMGFPPDWTISPFQNGETNP
jgi:hypothetical protein